MAIKRDLAAIKRSVRLSDIVGQSVQLRPDGREFKGCCPFHTEKTPSFTVNDEKNFYKCFGCGAYGDVYDFLRELYGMTQGQAATYLTGETPVANLKPVRDLPPPASPPVDIVKILPTTRATPLLDTDGRTVKLWNPKRRGTDKEFTTLKPDAVYEYRTLSGDLIGYVLRVMFSDGSKFTPTIQWCMNVETLQKNWTLWRFSEPRPLYGLHKLPDGGDTVIIVEGEKCADALQPLTNLPVLTWPQGTQNTNRADWSLLAGKNIIIWPDHDQPGNDAVYGTDRKPGIIRLLTDAGAASTRVVLPPAEKPKGWDVADAIAEGMEEAAILTLLDSAATTLPEYIEKQTEQEIYPPAVEVTPDRFDDAPFRFLGYNRKYHYFLSKKTQQVFEFSARELRDIASLLCLAPLFWWEKKFIGEGEGTFSGARITYAVNMLLQKSTEVEVFTPQRLRGRGCWWEQGQAVAHLGDALFVNGNSVGIYNHESRHIYERAGGITADVNNPLTATEASQLTELCEMLAWEKTVYGQLLSGWIMASVVCGALTWRPHIWITAPAGAGKSWVMDKIIKPCLGDFAVAVQASTTEAGIRQRLKFDAMPVLFDEAEGESDAARKNMENVMQLMRQASSEGGELLKGGGGNGQAVAYNIKAAFAFSSIGVNVKHHADASRVTVLSLLRDSTTEGQQHFQEVIAPRTIDTLTDTFCARLRGRAIRMIPIIRRNAEIFSVVAGNFIGSKRAGDQIGALLAGAYALQSDNTITTAEAMEWVKQQAWENNQSSDDAHGLLSHILQHIIKFEYQGKHYDRSIGELVELVQKATSAKFTLEMEQKTFTDPEELNAILGRYGIKHDIVDGIHYVAFSTNHRGLATILKDTAYGLSWSRILGRIDGAQTFRKIIRFSGSVSRATHIPLTALEMV